MAHCINHKHPDIKILSNNFSMSPKAIAAVIAVWQERTGQMDRFPTIEELEEELQPEVVESPIMEKVITPSIKSGVESLFESNPELAAIGSPEQYSAYLDTIFPDYIDNFAYEAVEELLVSNKIIDRKC